VTVLCMHFKFELDIPISIVATGVIFPISFMISFSMVCSRPFASQTKKKACDMLWCEIYSKLLSFFFFPPSTLVTAIVAQREGTARHRFLQGESSL
jgi:hypothetical protein